jgi:hypothetical protein
MVGKGRRDAPEVSVSVRFIESASIVVIALAVLFGGFSLLATLANYHLVAAPFIVVLAFVQLLAVRRNALGGGASAGVRSARDIAFLAALVAALFFVVWPARWAIGTAIVAVEFGLILELLARLGPRERPSA